MSEKNPVKVSLGTVICIIIIVVLIATLGIVYYFGFINNKEISKLKEQIELLENKTSNNTDNKEKTNTITTENVAIDDFKKEIFKKDFDAIGGYTFNMTDEELATELMKRIKDTNPGTTVEKRKLSGLEDWIAIGWFDGENELEVTGINIYSTNGYVSSIECTPAKYGSGDVAAITVPENLYEEAKKILGSETEEWKNFQKEGKINEKTYDVFTGDELKTQDFYAGMRKVLSF